MNDQYTYGPFTIEEALRASNAYKSDGYKATAYMHNDQWFILTDCPNEYKLTTQKKLEKKVHFNG